MALTLCNLPEEVWAFMWSTATVDAAKSVNAYFVCSQTEGIRRIAPVASFS
jgi:hypothetical protein